MIRTSIRALAFTFALGGVANAAEPIAFVTCPILRDTKTVPCWIAEFQGKTYFLGIQTDASSPVLPPSLGHKVLVEGAVSSKPELCGGIVLDPVSLAVLPELDGSCNTLLPAEDKYQIVDYPRPPGPSGGRLAFTYREPEKIIEPYQPRTFKVLYDFNIPAAGWRSAQPLGAATTYGRTIKAKEIEVVGYRGEVKLSDGTTITEDASMAEARAKDVAKLLADVGFDPTIIKTRAVAKPQSATGVASAQMRRTEIIMKP